MVGTTDTRKLERIGEGGSGCPPTSTTNHLCTSVLLSENDRETGRNKKRGEANEQTDGQNDHWQKTAGNDERGEGNEFIRHADKEQSPSRAMTTNKPNKRTIISLCYYYWRPVHENFQRESASGTTGCALLRRERIHLSPS